MNENDSPDIEVQDTYEDKVEEEKLEETNEAIVEEQIIEPEEILNEDVIVASQEIEIVTESIEIKNSSDITEMENLKNESYDPEFEPKEEIIELETSAVLEDVSLDVNPSIEEKPMEQLLPAVICENSIFPMESQNELKEGSIFKEETKKEENQLPDKNPFFQSRKLKSKKKIFISLAVVILFLGILVSIFAIIKAFM